MKILTIKNKTGRVRLDDTVDEYSRRQLAEEMAKVFGADAFANPEFVALTNSADNQVDRLEIEINSPGGSVFDGMMIVNELRAMSARGVRTVAIVNVLAASMGSVIAASCDECLIVDNGRMMIHDVSLFSGGNAKDFRRYADLLDGLSNEIAAIYAKKTGKTTEEMRALMLDETWLDAQQCIALGLANGIFDFRAESGKIASMSYLARLTNPAQPEALEKIQGLEAAIAEKDSAITELTGELELLKTQVQDFATAKALFESQLETLTAEMVEKDRLSNESAQTISDLQAKLEAAEQGAGAKAAELLAKAGQPEPVSMSGSEEQPPLTEAEKIKNMSPAERTRYFRAKKKGNK